MRVVSFTELRNHLATHLDRVESDRTEIVVTRQNHDPVVIVSLAEWEGMKETLHLLGTPANAERLLASIAEAEAGETTERELIEP